MDDVKILYVYGKTDSKDIVYTVRKLGYKVDEYFGEQSDFRLVEEEIQELTTYIQENAITHLLSIHMLYNLLAAANRTEIKYIAILWDAPCLPMLTDLSKSDNLWVSTFDKLDYERFKANGAKHVLYQPLAVEKDSVERWDVKRKLGGNYIHDISFVGRLYEWNLYDKYVKSIPLNMQEYFTSIMYEAAFKWNGGNQIYGTVNKEILDYIKMVSPDFRVENPYKDRLADERFFEMRYLVGKIANVERICCLNLLAEQWENVAFYTDSNIGDAFAHSGLKVMPPVEAGEALSIIYAGSKINLNISLRGIERGTPLRVFDIMGAGGFMLTSYCPETAELFEEDKEIVMFRSPEELMEKAAYYLAHDGEREQIAHAGCKKVLNCYTYEKKLKQLMEWVEEGER